MTSEAFIWVWLPGEHEPVVCGKLQERDGVYHFVYGQSYLQRANAIPLDPRELPLQEGTFSPGFGETHSVIRDAAPDAWGRRVLLYRSGWQSMTELDFLLQAGRDRIGALDVWPQPEGLPPHEPENASSLEDMLQAAERLQSGENLPESLGNALLHGSSVGGARPKALLQDGDRKWVAKFSSSTDHYPVVKGEYAAMWLAEKCGITVPKVKLIQALDKDVLLVERFDRYYSEGLWSRRQVISGLTALQLHETEAPLASYPDLASFIRQMGGRFPEDAVQLYRRMTYNILIGNTDDHARNHAFFWDGKMYELTPAYDICPLLRAGLTGHQAMIIGGEGRESTLRNGLSQAGQFGLDQQEATEIQEEMVELIRKGWEEAAERAGLSKHESAMLRQVTVLSPACFYR